MTFDPKWQPALILGSVSDWKCLIFILILYCILQADQRKIFIHNSGLLDYASNIGFEVVDTFNITMARYKDFRQGKCACHFHKVRHLGFVF